LLYKQNLYEQPVTLDTKYDLASLTKVVGTLTAIMHLYDDRKLNITDPVSKFIPEYDNNMKRNTTIQNLLLHNAGLLPDYPGALPATKDEVMTWIYFCKLDYPIGTKFVYSDLSFILLGEIVERITKKTLDGYLKELLVYEMSMKNTNFTPLAEEWYKIAPT
jgi:CubicO group peptidase (beta-lactamase class C family)